MSRLEQLRAYFAPQPDPYAGGDLANAQRLGALLWLIGIVLVVTLWPLSPPTGALGEAGWIPAILLVLIGFGFVYALRTEATADWGVLLAVAYAALFMISAMQWLAFSVEAPYLRLLLLPIGFVAAIHPPRKITGFLALCLVAMIGPFLYDRWDAHAAGTALASFVIWVGLAIVISILMSGVRAQRLAHVRTEAEAREEARADPLTGLHNRRAFDEILNLEVKRAKRLGTPLCMAMVDIENFKQVNDHWSYAEGDRCLQSVAATVRRSLRDPDHCFRWGGDEFSIILSGTSADNAGPLGERLANEVAAACRRPDGEPIQIRFAVAELREGMPPAELVELAGLALTSAKSGNAR